jgi:hypothetical protein
MKVKNINGTWGNTCKCGSWLKHWKNFSGQPLPTYCSEENCNQKPEAGSHVQKDDSSGRSWYIIPLCKFHDREMGRSLTIKDTVNLVSANVSLTCGKK